MRDVKRKRLRTLKIKVKEKVWEERQKLTFWEILYKPLFPTVETANGPHMNDVVAGKQEWTKISSHLNIFVDKTQVSEP